MFSLIKEDEVNQTGIVWYFLSATCLKIMRQAQEHLKNDLNVIYNCKIV